MTHEIRLKNSENVALIDEQTYEFLTTDIRMKKIDFLNNLRQHSSGCAVFQKTSKIGAGTYETETLYLHKVIAERFLVHAKTGKKKLVGAKNGNKLDCRIENLEYRSRATASRKRKTTSSAGYTGVYRENRKFRAVISYEGRAIHLGMFATPEKAALAYNEKSRELFGNEGKINIIQQREELRD